jgi:hypothetical protein
MNKHVKRALGLGLAFGGAMAGYQYFRTGRLMAVVPGLVAGAIFGAGMAWYTARAESRLLKKGFDVGTMDPIQERRVVLDRSFPEAFKDAKDALQAIPKLKIKEMDSAAGSITASVGTTMRSFGEKVTLILSPTEGGTIVTISSQPRMTGTDADGGKGVENVESIVQLLIARGGARRAA